jgi:tetratricopeptide (TPR) repeat protein
MQTVAKRALGEEKDATCPVLRLETSLSCLQLPQIRDDRQFNPECSFGDSNALRVMAHCGICPDSFRGTYARGVSNMAQESNAHTTAKLSWQPKSLVVMCAVCLAMGFVAGYLLRGSAPGLRQTPLTAATANSNPRQPVGAAAGQPQEAQPQMHEMPTLDDLKRMADKKAAPLLEKLKSGAKNPQLENQIGLIYENAHQFKRAAGYFEQSLQHDPKNIAVRADYASCLYYSGDVDGALAQLNLSLTYDPKHAGTLMNIGIIKWRGKNDVDGAVAAWEKLLQYNPEFPQKDLVQHMITEAKHTKTGAGFKG